MKYLLLALAIFLLLVQLVSGNWYVKKCANKSGNCRSKCRTGEVQIVPPTGMCSKEKTCCVLNGRELNPVLCGGGVGGSSGGGTGSTGGPGGTGSSRITGTLETRTRSMTAGANTTPASTTAKVAATTTH